MHLVAFFDGWTDGLKSNLLAEFCGFVFGTLVTLFGVNRLLELRERSRLAPLRERFANRIETTLELMAMGWAMRLSIAGEGEVLPDLHVGVLKAVDDIEKGLVETLREGIARGDKPQVLTLADQTVDLVGEISLAADRFPQVVTSDVALAELVEDIEQKANQVALILKRENEQLTPEGERALVAGSLEILRKTEELYNLLNAAAPAK
jgi:hypothetical protein